MPNRGVATGLLFSILPGTNYSFFIPRKMKTSSIQQEIFNNVWIFSLAYCESFLYIIIPSLQKSHKRGQWVKKKSDTFPKICFPLSSSFLATSFFCCVIRQFSVWWGRSAPSCYRFLVVDICWHIGAEIRPRVPGAALASAKSLVYPWCSVNANYPQW